MFVFLTSLYSNVRDFVESGGWVLLLLAGVLFLMWALVVEQWLYQRWVFPRDLEEASREWHSRRDRRSWWARQIRDQIVSELGNRLRRSLPLVRTLIILCPLVGLLGTVTGMIAVFDVMAMMGTGNPRAMASGVSQATIPAMAGMVAALSGLFAQAVLDREATKRQVELDERIETET